MDGGRHRTRVERRRLHRRLRVRQLLGPGAGYRARVGAVSKEKSHEKEHEKNNFRKKNVKNEDQRTNIEVPSM